MNNNGIDLDIFSDSNFLSNKLIEISERVSHVDAYYLREAATSLEGLWLYLIEIASDPLHPAGGSSQPQEPSGRNEG